MPPLDDLMSQPDVRAWGPPDVSLPSLARVWDHLTGGKNAFQVDRDTVDQMCETFPGWRELALTQRRFVARAVDYLAGEAGVRQFLDIGCGFPSPHLLNVHQIAQRTHTDAHVLSVDHDPVVLAHSRALVADNRRTAALLADAIEPTQILDHPLIRRLLNLDQPYAVLLCGVLHHLTDEQDPIGVAEQFTAAMPPGSYLVVCNVLGEDNPAAEEAERAFDKAFTGCAVARFRPWEQQRPYLRGLDLVPPGLVYADDWHPDKPMPAMETPEHTLLCAGIGRKP